MKSGEGLLSQLQQRLRRRGAAVESYRMTPGRTCHPLLRGTAAGYRHIDCASVYGNQALVGEGLRDFIAQVGAAAGGRRAGAGAACSAPGCRGCWWLQWLRHPCYAAPPTSGEPAEPLLIPFEKVVDFPYMQPAGRPRGALHHQ